VRPPHGLGPTLGENITLARDTDAFYMNSKDEEKSFKL